MATSTAGAFTAGAPVRVLDTRSGRGTAAPGPLGRRSTLHLRLAGTAGLPASGVGALALNVTVTAPAGPGYLTVWPAGTPQPGTSNVNFGRGQTLANFAVLGAGPDAGISIFNGCWDGGVHVLVDVVGWAGSAGAGSSGSGYVPVAPARLVDTRWNNGAPLRPDGTLTVPVAGRAGVPATATGALMNVTVTQPSADGFVTLYPAGEPRPDASTLNVTRGATRANTALVKLGADGGAAVFSRGGTAHVLLDVVGYLDPAAGGGAFWPVVPQRVYDSRRAGEPLGPGEIADVPLTWADGVPDSARAVAVNITGVTPTAPTFLAAWPAGTPRPGISNVNLDAGAVTANLAVLAPDASGWTSLYNHAGRCHVVLDVVGYFA